MRIISNFKDYYDSLQDPTDRQLTYVRSTLELDSDDPVSDVLGQFYTSIPKEICWRHDRKLGQDLADRIQREWHDTVRPKFVLTKEFSYWVYQPLVVLFCGKVHTGIRYSERWDHLMGYEAPKTRYERPNFVDKFYWDLESFVQDHEAKSGKFKYADDRAIERSVKRFYDTAFKEIQSDQLMDMHFKTGCPVIELNLATKSPPYRVAMTSFLNPRLADLQFVKKMPPYTAFQELSMFLGGVLSNNDKPDTVDNKYKILAHGFDLKESFRKGPTKSHQ